MPASLFVSRRATPCKQIALVEAQQAPQHQGGVGNRLPQDRKAIDQNWWDTFYLLPGIGEQEILVFNSRTFAPGTPQAGQIKDESEFNMELEGGVFPSPDEATIFGAKIHDLADVVTGERPLATDLEMIRAATIISVIQGGKNIQQDYLLDRFSAPGFLGGATANATGNFVNFGPPMITDWYPFNEPLPVPTGMSFAFMIRTQPEFQIEQPVRMRMEIITQYVTTTR